MKKMLTILGVAVALITVIILTVCVESRYSLDAKVIEKNDSIITFEDTTGNLWSIEDTENIYQIGNDVKLTWNDKGTDFKTDDEIIKIEIK